MTEKELYTSPEVKVFNVRIEGVICQSGLGDPGAAGKGFTDGDNINDYNGWF